MFECGGDGREGVASRAIVAELLFASALDESGGGEGFQLQRDGAESDVVQCGVNLSGRLLTIPDEPQNFSASWRREGGEGGRGQRHGSNLDETKIQMQAIFLSCARENFWVRHLAKRELVR